MALFGLPLDGVVVDEDDAVGWPDGLGDSRTSPSSSRAMWTTCMMGEPVGSSRVPLVSMTMPLLTEGGLDRRSH